MMADRGKQGPLAKMEQLPCSFLCIAGTALTLSILSFIIALIPIIAFSAQSDSTSTSDDSAAAAGSVSDRSAWSDPGARLTINREIHQTTPHATTPNITSKIAPPVLDSDRYSDYRQTYYVGGWWGWCYMWWYDFIENEQDYDGKVLYPLSPIHAHYGDRLVFRTYASWARDPLVIVPRVEPLIRQ